MKQCSAGITLMDELTQTLYYSTYTVESPQHNNIIITKAKVIQNTV